MAAVIDDHGADCLNCGSRLTGAYCARCGQPAHLHNTLVSIVHDLLHGAFHFEGKILRTLPMLAWRPGELTRRYIEGERARFVSPLAAFLFGVFLLFAAIESAGPPIHPALKVDGRAVAAGELDAELAKARASVARIEAARRAALAQGRPTQALDQRLAAARDDVTGSVAASRLAHGLADPANAAPDSLKTGYGPLDERIAAARANPTLVLYQLQVNAHKFAWLLIPLSLPFMWAMFAWRRAYRLFDHAVFVTYSQAAMLMLLAIMGLLGAAGVEADAALALVPVHFFRQLRGAYRLRIVSALWRTAALLVAATIVVLLFAAVLIAVGLAG